MNALSTLSQRARTAVGPLVAAVLVLTALLVSPSRAEAFGSMPLQSMSVQLQQRHIELFVERWEPGLLTPGGVARLLARALITTPSLDEIEWTVGSDTKAESIASAWGMPLADLVALNPDLELDRETPLAAGTQLVVYRADPENPTQSIGRCNKGKLRNGMPFPEGPHWLLRDNRRRHYGTELAIRSLMTAITSYRQAYPDGPPVRIGELSKRTGNRIKPHRSHRTGRDADIGYIGLDSSIGNSYWTKVTRNGNLDAEKTWALVKALIDTGNVQYIFIDRRIQVALSKVAERELSETELAALFEHPRRPDSHRALIQHWPGHSSHLHVRFRCTPGNTRCR